MALIAQVREFIKDVQVESGKVSWPTRNELRDSTMVVIAMVLILILFVYLADAVLRFMLGWVFK